MIKFLAATVDNHSITNRLQKWPKKIIYVDIMTGEKLSSIKLVNIELIYWSERSSSRWGGDWVNGVKGGIFFGPLHVSLYYRTWKTGETSIELFVCNVVSDHSACRYFVCPSVLLDLYCPIIGTLCLHFSGMSVFSVSVCF